MLATLDGWIEASTRKHLGTAETVKRTTAPTAADLPTLKARWAAAIAAKVKAGASAYDATCSLAREQPALREALVAAANTPAPKAARAVPSGVAEWNKAVSTKMAGGLSRSQAIRAVIVEQPALHKKYLEEYTAQSRC